VFEVAALDALVRTLLADGHRVVGPTVRDGVVVTDELATADDLPVGWGDEQAPGRYRLRRRDDGARFGWAVGPHSPRREVSPASVALVTIRHRTDPDGHRSFDAEPVDPTPDRPTAFFGVRPCEAAAMAVHDRVLVGGAHPDPVQTARNEGRVVVAVDCGSPAATCFCPSMGTGPALPEDRAEPAGVDLRLCELDPDGADGGGHRFVAWAGTDAGRRLLDATDHRPATEADLAAAAAVVADAEARIERRMPTDDLPRRLADAVEHPRWDDVAERCLSCTNCTLVCPTCFCSTVTDDVDLSGEVTTRTRTWDSCFTLDHSYLHGGSVHASVRSRYRQWLTHKLSTWWDQFGESGCVGCGRCITWCPAGIDLVEEARALVGEHAP